MTGEAETWATPPWPNGPGGQPRRVGVELEYNGVEVDVSAEIVRDCFGGSLERAGPHRVAVRGGRLGDFLCELDVKFAHREWRSAAARRLRDTAARLSAEVLPIEIVCPPIPWPEAHALEALRENIALSGASGTNRSFFFAFGVQINPELHSLDLAEILRVCRAYLLLSDRLRDEIGVDSSRRIWFFEARFPPKWRKRVLDSAYQPGIAGFIDDYIADNPTRNRELDLLPLLAHLDPERVRAALPSVTIKPRPTWHWRLPNSEIDRPDWSIGDEWRRWLTVERLAADDDAFEEAWTVARDGGAGRPPMDARRRIDAIVDALARTPR